MKLADPKLGALEAHDLAHDLALDEANAAIARMVRARRTRLGVSLAALAAASGVELAILNDLEGRRRGCSAVDLWRIAQALGASLSELCQLGSPRRRGGVRRTFQPPDAAAMRPATAHAITRH